MNSVLQKLPTALYEYLRDLGSKPETLAVVQKPSPTQQRPYLSVSSKIETPGGRAFGRGGSEVVVSLSIFTEDNGDKAAAEFAEWTIEATDGARLTVAGRTSPTLRATSGTVLPDPDGGYMAIVRVSARSLEA